MAIRRSRLELKPFRTLFHVGTIGDLTDGQLLERFGAGRGETSELAFAALVERHGSLVLRVCRSVLRDEHDAQDAFQATFLVLVKKARSLWVRDSLGPWLHAVAFRAAACSRSARDRRRVHERRAAEMASEGIVSVEECEGLEPALHEEIERLPARYRLPLVLCDLGGRTHEQAARHLGCPVGTVKSRLARGRERLRNRLIRRGVGPAVGLSALAASEAACAAVPAVLAESTIQAALGYASGLVLARGLPAAVATRMEGALRNMTLTQLRRLAVSPLIVALVMLGAGVFAQQDPGKDRKAEAQRQVAEPPAQAPTRLGDAVTEFNASVANNPVGKDQPPLTEDEVIASIRGWIRNMRPSISDGGFETFQRIANSRELPAGSRLTHTTGWSGYRGFHFEVWWVDLTIPIPEGMYTYRIRDRMLRSRFLTEGERRLLNDGAIRIQKNRAKESEKR